MSRSTPAWIGVSRSQAGHGRVWVFGAGPGPSQAALFSLLWVAGSWDVSAGHAGCARGDTLWWFRNLQRRLAMPRILIFSSKGLLQGLLGCGADMAPSSGFGDPPSHQSCLCLAWRPLLRPQSEGSSPRTGLHPGPGASSVSESAFAPEPSGNPYYYSVERDA